MAVVFGSEVVAEEVFAVLAGLPDVISAVVTQQSIVNLTVVPESIGMPAVLHYAESGEYGAPIGGGVNYERLRYVVRFTCEGASTDPIKAAAEAAFAALNGHEANRDGAYLGFDVTGEWPLTTVLEGETLYRQLGFYLQVELTQGD